MNIKENGGLKILIKLGNITKDIGKEKFLVWGCNECHFDTSNTRFDDWLDEISIE